MARDWTEDRPEWDSYFLAMAMIAAARTTCLRRGVGAIIVTENRIVATGYNGAPSGARHCAEVGCLRRSLGIPSGERHEICRGAHAEMNAIAQAASSGTSINGCTVYTTVEPCSICCKLIINAGCRRVVYMTPYPDELSRTLFAEAGVRCEPYPDRGGVRDVLGKALTM
ncbi:MAG: cytidine/deoxycytidylate deaminase family protein [Synergistaceae bacterium]|nr:cytidine/deoxycytidylate deaminase family protein [Synergistaceae bacterium]